MKSKIRSKSGVLSIERYDESEDEMELGETLLVTEKEVHLLVQHLQEKHPERSVLEYLNSRYGE